MTTNEILKAMGLFIERIVPTHVKDIHLEVTVVDHTCFDLRFTFEVYHRPCISVNIPLNHSDVSVAISDVIQEMVDIAIVDEMDTVITYNDVIFGRDPAGSNEVVCHVKLFGALNLENSLPYMVFDHIRFEEGDATTQAKLMGDTEISVYEGMFNAISELVSEPNINVLQIVFREIDDTLDTYRFGVTSVTGAEEEITTSEYSAICTGVNIYTLQEQTIDEFINVLGIILHNKYFDTELQELVNTVCAVLRATNDRAYNDQRLKLLLANTPTDIYTNCNLILHKYFSTKIGLIDKP